MSLSLGLVLTPFYVIFNKGKVGLGSTLLCLSDLIFKQALVVIQDLLRVLIIRIACQNADNASVLLQPILSWIRDSVSESSSPSDTDVYKVNIFCHYYSLEFIYSDNLNVIIFHLSDFFSLWFQIYRLLDFLGSLLEHPCGKVFYFSLTSLLLLLLFFSIYAFFSINL